MQLQQQALVAHTLILALRKQRQAEVYEVCETRLTYTVTQESPPHTDSQM